MNRRRYLFEKWFPQMQLQCAPRRKLSLMVVLSRIIGKVWKPKGSQNITSFQVKDTYFFTKILMKNRIHFIKNPGIRRFQEGKTSRKRGWSPDLMIFRRILFKSKKFYEMWWLISIISSESGFKRTTFLAIFLKKLLNLESFPQFNTNFK